MAVTAPAANTWDVDEIVEGALAVLRVDNDDVDVPRIERDALTATQLIDVELDMEPVDELEPAFDAGAVPALVAAAVKLTAELYQAPPSLDGPPDPVASVRSQVRPWKQRWGIA